MIEIELEPDEHIKTIAEVIGHYYKGEIIQVYWGESGGTTFYADYDVTQNMYVEGKVLWGNGEVFALECDVPTTSKTYKKVIIFNAWGVQFVCKKDNVGILNVLKGKI